MRQVQASYAKTHLPQLLDSVEQGEVITITRHGRIIARLVPERSGRPAAIDEAVRGLKELRAEIVAGGGAPVTLDEIKSWRDAGRR